MRLKHAVIGVALLGVASFPGVRPVTFAGTSGAASPTDPIAGTLLESVPPASTVAQSVTTLFQSLSEPCCVRPDDVNASTTDTLVDFSTLGFLGSPKPAAVRDPATLGLLASGLLVLGVIRRRRA